MTKYIDTRAFGDASHRNLVRRVGIIREADAETISSPFRCGSLALMKGISEPDEAATDVRLKAAGNRGPPNAAKPRQSGYEER